MPKNIQFLFLFSFLVLIIGQSTFEYVFAQETRIPKYEVFDLEGNPVSLKDLEGNPVLINVWATWCEPCRRELPYLQSLHEKYSENGLIIVGTSIDTAGKDEQVKSFSETMGMTYTVWRDSSDKATFAFRMMGVPETVLLASDGSILHQWKGPIEPGMDVEPRIENALGITSDLELESLASIQNVGLAIAFSAGLLSFLSPCILPLIPAYTSFITGMSLKELSSKSSTVTNSGNTQSKFKIKTTVLGRGSMFVLGFTIVFVTLGVTVSYASSFFVDATTWIERIGGIIIIAFGLHLLGILNIKRLNQQKSFDFSKRSTKNVGSILVGMAFGAGWTPCIGPILAGILTIAATSSTISEGALLLGAYSTGLAIPFILSALAIDQFLIFFQKIKKWIGWIERISGIMLIGIGILLLTGSLTVINSIFSDSLISDLQDDEFV